MSEPANTDAGERMNSRRNIANRRDNVADFGFTLIEILVVIVILGILAGIAVIAVGGLSSSSVQSSCQSDFKSVEVAVETYKTEVGAYPTLGLHGIPASGVTDAVPSTTTGGLLAGDTSDTPNLGPWLRDQPTNGTHYRIEVPLAGSYSGTGTVQVYKFDGSAPMNGTITGSISDCSYAK